MLEMVRLVLHPPNDKISERYVAKKKGKFFYHNTNRHRMRRIKNRSGKIMSKTNREKLPRVRAITTRLIPLVEGFTFV
jgi:hypothetical protein